MLGSGPERQEVVEGPGELIAGMSVDGLEETEDDPAVHGQDVEIFGDGGPDNGRTDGAET